MIQTLKVCSPAEKERLRRIIQDGDRGEGDLDYVIRAVKEYRGIEYTFQAAETFVEKAKNFLAPFPISQEKEALLALADYAIQRKR